MNKNTRGEDEFIDESVLSYNLCYIIKYIFWLIMFDELIDFLAEFTFDFESISRKVYQLRKEKFVRIYKIMAGIVFELTFSFS